MTIQLNQPPRNPDPQAGQHQQKPGSGAQKSDTAQADNSKNRNNPQQGNKGNMGQQQQDSGNQSRNPNR
ncbi:MAG: hypothetical protein V4488_25540 [Pseudomonadota bacterium]